MFTTYTYKDIKNKNIKKVIKIYKKQFRLIFSIYNYDFILTLHNDYNLLLYLQIKLHIWLYKQFFIMFKLQLNIFYLFEHNFIINICICNL